MAVLHKNLWASGEDGALNAKGSDDNPDADFSEFYSEVGIFFDCKKTYKDEKFNRCKVTNPIGESTYGAVFLVARYESVNLEDAAYARQLDAIILGADWWLTK